MNFRFMHAADLHLDSPLRGLSAKDEAVAARFARASRTAFVTLIDRTIAEKADFLIIAGDVFDGDWRDFASGLFFARELARLGRAGIRTVVLRGNHDAESQMSRQIKLPDGVHLLDAAAPETLVFDDLGVALHGQSFRDRAVPESIVQAYPSPRRAMFNIGVLHTSCDGREGHAAYAPCTPADLRLKGYDYWALGHVHVAEIVSRDPWIVYPGNLQGRSIRETGPKGAFLVDVRDGAVTDVQPVVTDAARWALLGVALDGADDIDAALAAVETALAGAIAACEGRPLAARVVLSGQTAAHPLLCARRAQVEAEIQAAADRHASDAWIERVVLATRHPRAPSTKAFAEQGVDPAALIEAVDGDAALREAVEQMLAEIRNKLPQDVRDEPDLFGDAATLEVLEEARAVALGRLAADAEK